MPKESSAQGGRSYCQVHCSSFYQDGPTGLRSGLSNSMTVEETISMFRKQEEKKKKSKPTWNAGISRPVVMPFSFEFPAWGRSESSESDPRNGNRSHDGYTRLVVNWKKLSYTATYHLRGVDRENQRTIPQHP